MVAWLVGAEHSEATQRTAAHRPGARCRWLGLPVQPRPMDPRRAAVRNTWILPDLRRKAVAGRDKEWFTKDTWIHRDICDRTPWPFSDEQFDFVICSHTLEDLRDPLWVCTGMIRVGKRGYIEMPSRAYESSLGIERPNQAGLSHHRWLIDICGNEISFLHKYHMIHSHWRFALPSCGRATRELRPVVVVGRRIHVPRGDVSRTGRPGTRTEEYVRRTYPYPEWRLRLSELWRRFSALPRRAAARAIRGIRHSVDHS